MHIQRTKAGSNYLTEGEEKKLFNTLKQRKESQAERDFVLLKLCRLTGLRRAEALSLNIADIRNKSILVVDQRISRKGAMGEVYLPLELREHLKRFLFLKRRWKQGLDDDDPLFISKKGNRLSVRAFNDVVTKWCREANIPRYTPHAFRHTKGQRIMSDIHALNRDEAAKKLLFAQKQLRHKDINNTLIYTAPTKEQMERVGGI